MIKILVVHIGDLYLSDRIDMECWCFRSEHESNNPIPRVFSHWTMHEWMYNSCTLQQQRTMSFSYQSVSSGRNSRANLCRLKVSKWHIAYRNLSQKPFGHALGIYVLKNWFSVKVQQHYLLLLFNICLVLINFRNSGLTYKDV